MSATRIVWLLDDRSPTGANVMALRRAKVLGGRVEQAVLALRPGPTPPSGSPLRKIGRAGGTAGELAVARARVIVSTSELTLAAAAARATYRNRLVHFVHEPARVALGRARVARALPSLDRLVVPQASDLARVGALAHLPGGAVVRGTDFVAPEDSLLSSARARVVLVVGRLADDSVLDVLDGFVRAGLADWQLRVAGDGPGLAALQDRVESDGLGDRVGVLGACHDLSRRYVDAGVVVRLGAPEADGLPVLEALAAGVPVLASPASPAAARHIRTGENGILLKRSDPDAVADALRELADDDRRASCAAAARDEPVGLLDEAGRQSVHELFEQVAHEPHARSSLRDVS